VYVFALCGQFGCGHGRRERRSGQQLQARIYAQSETNNTPHLCDPYPLLLSSHRLSVSFAQLFVGDAARHMEEEYVYGYRGLHIRAVFAADTLYALLSIQYEQKLYDAGSCVGGSMDGWTGGGDEG
jgi:hypothetical protein